MPGFDGTGPAGRGPMTGGGRGYCSIPLTGQRWPFFGRGFWGRGGGRGFRNRFWATGLTGWERAGLGYPASGINPYSPELTPQQEIEMLKQDAESLKSQLEEIQNRIEILEKHEKTAKTDK
jgi:hypothetical protein